MPIVVATYQLPLFFNVPEGVDLEDKTVVEKWWVKWGILFIRYVGASREVEIKGDGIEKYDFKWASDVEIQVQEI